MKTMAMIAATLVATGTGLAQTDDGAALRVPIDADGVQRVTIVGGSYFFRPNHVVVTAHAPVELTVSSQPGIVPHSFEIDAPQAGIDVRTELGTTPKTFRFTPSQPAGSPTIARIGCRSSAAIANAGWKACSTSRPRRDCRVAGREPDRSEHDSRPRDRRADALRPGPLVSRDDPLVGEERRAH